MNIKKTTRLFFTLTFIFCLSSIEKISAQGTESIKVQVEKDNKSINLKRDTIANFTSFTGKEISGNIYLQWKVRHLKEDGTFIIYSSVDGKEYHPFGIQKAIGVPIDNEIGYYFKEKTTEEAKRYFKLVYLSKDAKFLESERLILITENTGLITKRE